MMISCGNFRNKNRNSQMYALAAMAICLAGISLPAQGQPASSTYGSVVKGPYGKDLRECKSNWAAVSRVPARITDCMAKLFFAIVPQLESPEGIKALGIQSFNPLHTKDYNLGDGGTVGGKFLNGRAYNAVQAMKDPKRVKFIYDADTRTVKMIINFAAIQVLGDYELYFNFGSLFGDQSLQGVHSSGTSRMEFRDASYEITLFLREKKNGGGLVVAKADATAGKIGSMDMKFTPNDPNDPVANLLNAASLAGDSAAELVKESLTPMNRVLAQMVGTLYHQGWRNLEKL